MIDWIGYHIDTSFPRPFISHGIGARHGATTIQRARAMNKRSDRLTAVDERQRRPSKFTLLAIQFYALRDGTDVIRQCVVRKMPTAGHA